MAKLHIKPKVLLSYLTLVEDHYHSFLPYHNSIHGADVSQTMHYLLSLPSLQAWSSKSYFNDSFFYFLLFISISFSIYMGLSKSMRYRRR